MWRPRMEGRSRKLPDCKAWRKKSRRPTTTATSARSAGRASIRPSLHLHRSWTSRRPKLRDSMLQNLSASIRLHHNCLTRWGLSYPSRVAEVEPDVGGSSYIRGGRPHLSQKCPGPCSFSSEKILAVLRAKKLGTCSRFCVRKKK